jgi:hypothetical protein
MIAAKPCSWRSSTAGDSGGSHRGIQSGQQGQDHVVVLPQHVRDPCGLGVLLHHGREEQGVLTAMMSIERDAEPVAEEEKITGGGGHVAAVASRVLRCRQGEAQACVRLKQLPPPSDQPGDVAHATMSVRAFM